MSAIKTLAALLPPVALYRALTSHPEPVHTAASLEARFPELAGVAAQFAFVDKTDLWNER